MVPSEVVVFMRNVLEEAGYEIEESLEYPGWTWGNGAAECEKALPTMDAAVQDAWASAASFVNDVLGGHIAGQRWDSLSMGQQAKLILLCFDEDEGDDDEAILVNGLFAAIRENGILKATLAALGRDIEGGNPTTAAATWRRAKHEHLLGAI